MSQQDILFVQGNEACVRGALYAGLRFFAGYPITPSTEVAEHLAEQLPRVGGKFIQMEDEIASMCAVCGASLAGSKAMTATSGPGFSLKQEAIGYAVMAEIPCVVVNVQRGGPSTGLATKVAQGDVNQARWGTHGDHSIIVLTASSIQDVFQITVEAFNMAETYRTPVILLFDEVIGHMREKLVVPAAGELPVVERLHTEVQAGVNYYPYLPREDGRLPMQLVTHQTGPQGKKVHKAWVEQGTNIARELYLAVVLDRGAQCLTVMASPDGGMDIEEVAAKTPERIFTTRLDGGHRIWPFQARALLFGCGLTPAQVNAGTALLLNLVRLAAEKDAVLVEINPLAVTAEGELMALDGKMDFDESALKRHPDIAALEDPEECDPLERKARELGVNYVRLSGYVGTMLVLQCLFTGAGPKTTALTPVVIAYATTQGIDPTPFVLLVGMNMLHQYLLPVSNLPNIIGLATEEITPAELIKTGAVMSLFGAIFMSIMVYTYWTWIGMFG